MTSLHFSVMNNAIDIVKLLLAYEGTDVNIK